MVDRITVPFDLPNMRINPFNIKPLTTNDKQLLVGRKDIISNIIGWCKHRSSRMVLLVGNRGTGRTSLLNLLGGEAFKHFQFNIFPTKEPMKRLLEELYITVVSDFEVPRMSNQLQDNLIKALPETGRLPILSFDYPNISGSEIADVFKQITQIIRSLDAVSIIALTPSQLATWPQELIDEFDEEIRINSFDKTEIKEMIAKRVKSASRDYWNPPSSLVEEIEERSSGHPSESIKLMRKIVHGIKNEDLENKELKDMFSNMKSKLNDTNDQDDEIETYESEIIEDEEDFGSLSEEDYIEDYPQEDEDLEPIKVELEQINEDYDEQEINEDEIITNNINYEKTIPENIQAPLPAGGFGKLSGRTRNTNESMRKDGFAVFPSDFEAINNIQAKTTTLQDNEEVTLWVNNEIVPTTQFNQVLSKEKQINNNQINNNNIIEQSSSFEGALRDIQQQNDKFIPPESSFELNIERLRSLDENEIKVIKLSSKREISPSDNEMREILGGIGRTRASQIFNGLNKNGILSVKKVGRSRMFYLSNSAKSQLVAWGIL